MSSHLGVGFGEQYLILRCFYCWTLGTFGPDDPCVFEYFVLADSVSVDVFWIRAAALVAFVEFGRFLPLGANRGLNATLSYLAFMKFFRRVKKHVSVLAFILFFTIL